MRSIAFTNAVVWKGRIRVSQGQWLMMAMINAAVEARKTSHQMALKLFFCSMGFDLFVRFKDTQK